MSSRHLVAPDLLPLLDLIPSNFLRAETLEAARSSGTRAKSHEAALPRGLREWHQAIGSIPGAPPVPLLIVGPDAVGTDVPAILYIHGGGFVSGNPDQSRKALVELAQATGAVVAAPKYRLAPETPFPGGLEDCYAALKWLRQQAATLGVAPEKIAVVGASAGGALAAAVSLLARDRREVSIALQVLISPMLDDRTGASIDRGPYAGEFVWTAASNQFGWRSLLGDSVGGPAVSPYAAPARADDLERLAPALIMVGALDLLLEECLEYARRLARAGVPIEMKVYPGAPHAFSRIAEAGTTKAYRRDLAEALLAALSRA